MANTVTVRTLIDGRRHTVVHVHMKSDGVSGELDDFIVVDVSTLNPVPVNLTVEEIWYDLVGFDARLDFDSTLSDKVVWKLSSGKENHQDFRSFGGVKDNVASGGTGDVQMTTDGFTGLSDEGTIIIKVRKDF